jgi:hydroxyacylglutathione hydrolase
LVFDPEGRGEAVVIDPSEAEPVLAATRKHGLALRAILNTHHHWDHVGGNLELSDALHVPIYAHVHDERRVTGVTQLVEDRQSFTVADLSFEVRHVPGHTLGAVAYLIGKVCFTGDTLFCGGCGRLFEGTAQQMHHSLTKVLGELSGDTLVYCGHEYTEKNLQFASRVIDSVSVRDRLSDVAARRMRGEFCASATLDTERETNLFLRCHTNELKEALGQDSELSAFTELRRRKDLA